MKWWTPVSVVNTSARRPRYPPPLPSELPWEAPWTTSEPGRWKMVKLRSGSGVLKSGIRCSTSRENKGAAICFNSQYSQATSINWKYLFCCFMMVGSDSAHIMSSYEETIWCIAGRRWCSKHEQKTTVYNVVNLIINRDQTWWYKTV